jgi:hypothetical protein
MLRIGMLGLALAFILWGRHAMIPVVVVTHMVTPLAPSAPVAPASLAITLVITPVPPAPPAPHADPDPLGPCLAPFTAGTAGEINAPPDLPAITPSRYDVRLLAMWSPEALHVSEDEGGSFHRVLDHRGEIGDVAFDCRGRLHVIRGDGELGTYDPRTRTERWTRVATFWSRGDEVDKGRLILDGAGVAVIGNTPARRDRLWLVRRGEGDRWHAKHLFSDREQGYWSGIGVGSIRVLPGDRIRMIAMPNMNDFGLAECGYSKAFEVTFDPGARRIAVRDLGERDERPDDRLQQDPAGRWLLVANGRVSRLTSEELVERLATSPAP